MTDAEWAIVAPLLPRPRDRGRRRRWNWRVTVRVLLRCLGLEAGSEFGIVDEVIEKLVPGRGR